MTADEASLFDTTEKRRRIVEGDVLECPYCKDEVPLAEWVYCEDGIWCDDCGFHMAAECPRCRTRQDHVWANFRIVDKPQ